MMNEAPGVAEVPVKITSIECGPPGSLLCGTEDGALLWIDNERLVSFRDFSWGGWGWFFALAACSLVGHRTPGAVARREARARLPDSDRAVIQLAYLAESKVLLSICEKVGNVPLTSVDLLTKELPGERGPSTPAVRAPTLRVPTVATVDIARHGAAGRGACCKGELRKHRHLFCI